MIKIATILHHTKNNKVNKKNNYLIKTRHIFNVFIFEYAKSDSQNIMLYKLFVRLLKRTVKVQRKFFTIIRHR